MSRIVDVVIRCQAGVGPTNSILWPLRAAIPR